MTCYLCDVECNGRVSNTLPICQRCNENLQKLPKFGYERPRPPVEFVVKEAA